MNRPPELRIFGDDDVIVDLFAGGGGASVGIEWATGRSPDIAINHDKEAISIHRVNHPNTKHYIEDVWKANPRKLCRGKRVRLMWLSPDCKHFSKAKGGKPRSKKIRSLAWVAVYWAKLVKPDVISLENVEEFQKWGPLLPDGTPCPARMGLTFRRFVRQLENLGYDVEWRELVAADYGAPTTRKRLFLVARRDGQPIVWPRPTHDQHGSNGLPKWLPASDCINFGLPCPSIFERKKALAENTQRRIARGIEKFVKKDPFIVPVMHAGDSRVHALHEPMRTITGAHRGELALVRPQLDLFAPTGDVAPYLVGIDNKSSGASSAWDAKAPLKTVTLVNRFAVVAPFLKPRYGEREGQDPRVRSIDRPMPTVVPTTNGGDLVSAFLAKHNAGHEATGQRLAAPVDAITGRDSKALVTAHITQYNGGRGDLTRGGTLNEPLRTVTADPRHGLVASNLVKLRGTCQHGQAVTGPLGTVSAQGNHFAEVRAFLMKYHRDGGQLAGLKDPMPTVLANDSLALVTVEGEEYAIVDIGMRMLQPRELFRAHAFPADYIIERGADGEPMTKEAQVRMVGNSVPPVMAAAIVRAQFGIEQAAVAEAVA